MATHRAALEAGLEKLASVNRTANRPAISDAKNAGDIFNRNKAFKITQKTCTRRKARNGADDKR